MTRDARRDAIARALDNAAAQGAVTHWDRLDYAPGGRIWVVQHRGRSDAGGAHFTTPEAEAFCGLAARDLARPAVPA